MRKWACNEELFAGTMSDISPVVYCLCVLCVPALTEYLLGVCLSSRREKPVLDLL